MDHYKLTYSKKASQYYELSLTKEEAERLVKIMPDDVLKEFCRLRYIEKLTLEKTAEKMYYSKRQAERMNTNVKNCALKVLLQAPQPNTEALITIKSLADKMLNAECKG